MSLHTLTYYIDNIGTKEVCSTLDNLIPLVHILNDQKIKFKISDRSGALKQETLGIGDVRYWLNPEDSFDKDIVTNVSIKDKEESDTNNSSDNLFKTKGISCTEEEALGLLNKLIHREEEAKRVNLNK